MVTITERHDGMKDLLEMTVSCHCSGLLAGFMQVLSPVLSPHPFSDTFSFLFCSE